MKLKSLKPINHFLKSRNEIKINMKLSEAKLIITFFFSFLFLYNVQFSFGKLYKPLFNYTVYYRDVHLTCEVRALWGPTPNRAGNFRLDGEWPGAERLFSPMTKHGRRWRLYSPSLTPTPSPPCLTLHIYIHTYSRWVS